MKLSVKAILLGAAAAAALAVGLGTGLIIGDTSREDSAKPLANLLKQQVPDARGQASDLSGYKNQILVLNFWATWCAPCIHEMPDIDAIQIEYRDRDVHVLGLGLDTAERITAFSEKLKVSYPLFALDGAGLQVVRDFGNAQGALPYTLIYDRNGREVARKLGRISRDELKQAIDTALAATP